MITCDRDRAHHYYDTVAKRRYFSVSQVMKVVTGEQRWFQGDEPKDFGIRFHHIAATEYAAMQGLCPYPDIQQDEILTVNAYRALRQFNKDFEVEPVEVELAVTSDLGYAGTIDLYANVTYRRKQYRAVVDFKTGVKSPAHLIQITAYGKPSKPRCRSL